MAAKYAVGAAGVLLFGAFTLRGLSAEEQHAPPSVSATLTSNTQAQSAKIKYQPHADPAHFLPANTPLSTWDANWDRRLPTEDSTKRPTATRHLLLIRHGQYHDDEPDSDKRVLTEHGRKQMVLTGERLAKLPISITKIYHSDMPRAVESAAIVVEQLSTILQKSFPIEVDPMLREGSPIPTSPPLSSGHSGDVFWRDGARIEAAFRQHFYRASPSQEKDSVDVLICHANVIRYFVMRSLQLPANAWLRTSLPHGSITWVSIRPSGNVSLRYMGDAGFMPADMATT